MSALYPNPPMFALFTPLKVFGCWLSQVLRQRARLDPERHTVQQGSIHCLSNNQMRMRRASLVAAVKPIPKPLRVLRVLDADQQPSQIGRIRISGRMADVCAELERLAAFEKTSV